MDGNPVTVIRRELAAFSALVGRRRAHRRPPAPSPPVDRDAQEPIDHEAPDPRPRPASPWPPSLAACSGASAAPADRRPRPAPTAGDAVTIVAKDMKFQTDGRHGHGRQAASAIVFDNQDGAPHNVAISRRRRRRASSRARSSRARKVDLPGPGARRGHVLLPLRRPSRHEGHDHRRVTPRPPRSDAPAPPGASRPGRPVPARAPAPCAPAASSTA